MGTIIRNIFRLYQHALFPPALFAPAPSRPRVGTGSLAHTQTASASSSCRRLYLRMSCPFESTSTQSAFDGGAVKQVLPTPYDTAKAAQRSLKTATDPSCAFRHLTAFGSVEAVHLQNGAIALILKRRDPMPAHHPQVGTPRLKQGRKAGLGAGVDEPPCEIP